MTPDRHRQVQAEIAYSLSTMLARCPLNNLSSEEIFLGAAPDIEISMSGATPKTISSELRLLCGRLTL